MVFKKCQKRVKDAYHCFLKDDDEMSPTQTACLTCLKNHLTDYKNVLISIVNLFLSLLT